VDCGECVAGHGWDAVGCGGIDQTPWRSRTA
jgi:hypothetical protein